MPLDTSLLYGEMAGSAIMHGAAVLLIGTALNMMPYQPLTTKGFLLLGVAAALSFLIQFGFLTALQASSCKGVKDYKSIAGGSFVAAIVTAIMVAIPVFLESARLTVSQLFLEHKTLLTPAHAAIEEIAEQAGRQVTALQTGGALDAVKYDEQSFKEVMIGGAFWAAFAGAYGVGLGSLSANKCPATVTATS